MIKSYKVIKLITTLCCVLAFSCTNVKITDVVTEDKKTLAQPTFGIDETRVEYGTILKFSYLPNDALLSFTSDGTDPDFEDSETYIPSTGIELTKSCTIKARLYHSNYKESLVVEKQFSVYIDDPVISTQSTEITTATTFSLSHVIKNKNGKNHKADIYYTIDGDTPTEDLEEYDGTPFTLPAGDHTIKVIAIIDGIKSKIVTKTFTVIDTKGAYLNGLSAVADNNEYIKNFNTTNFNYSINLPTEIEKINITGTADDNCEVQGNDEISLAPGETKNVSIAVVNKESGKSMLYHITIYRASSIASDDASLLDLQLKDINGNVIPFDTPFTKDTTAYTALTTVDNVKVYFTKSHDKATTSIESETIQSLNNETTEILIYVTAENGINTKQYKIIVEKEQIDGPVFNTNLKSVTVEGNSIPVSDYMTYTTSASTVRVIATPEDEGVRMEIDGAAISGKEVTVPCTVNITLMDCEIKTYTLDIKKAASAVLQSLTVNGKDVPVNTLMNFKSDEPTAKIVAVTNDATASFTIDGVTSANGAAQNVVVSADGETATKTVKIILKSTDGQEVTYTLSVTYTKPIVPITDKIILHAYNWTNCYAWTGTNTELLGAWPGKTMTDEGNKWYGITLDVASANIIFNGSGQTDDLSREAGEWWYKDGKWLTHNPDDSQVPTVVWVAPANGDSLTGTEDLTVDATDDVGIDKIEFYVDEKLVGSIASGMTCSWDSANVANGTHKLKAVAYDKAGNKAETEEISVTTQNANKAPVANAGKDKTGTENVELTFDASQSTDNGTIKSYAWDFDDGTKSTEMTTKHAYSKAGTYTVTLTVADEEGLTGTTTIKVTINEKDSFVHRDFREENIYFMMTDRFCDGDKTNNNIWGDEYLPGGESQMYDFNESKTGILSYYHGGDFKGIINNLDYLVEMGFTAIWITPSVKQAEGRFYYGDYEASGFHGYWGYDFDQIDPHLHSSGKNSDGWDDYKAMVAACHEKGIRVMQDVVINHGNQSVSDPKTKWHALDGTVIMDGQTWTWETKDKYYDPSNLANGFYAYKDAWGCAGLIDFNDKSPDRKDARQHMINVYKKFIDAGVDAFRIDTVAYVTNEWCGEFADAMYNHAQSKGNNHFYMIGEAWCGRHDAVARHSKDTTDSLHMLDMHLSCLDYPGEMSSVFKDGGDYARFESVIASDAGWGTDKEEHTKTAMFVDNHDCFRNNGIYSEAQYKNALNYIYLFRGVPVVFYGTEAMYSWKGAHASTNKDDVVSRWMLGDQGINYVKQNKPTMYKHLKVLNKIRSASPCIQKGVQDNIEVSGDKAVFTRTHEGKTAYVAISKGAAYSQTFSNVKSGTYTEYSSGSDGNYTATDVTVSGSYSVNVPANGFAFIEPK
ncbi:MAG: PKD domain-containing protein [Spirochaetales bacterium]|nr:PKD domain-containing protein [Spirochaetales bacterium]